jgi:hypothetical protein
MEVRSTEPIKIGTQISAKMNQGLIGLRSAKKIPQGNQILCV